MKIAKAAAYAAQKHNGQFRKDGVTPYFYHCAMVAYFVQKYCSYPGNYYDIEDMICAAYLHDVVEDCGVTFEEVESEFGETIAGYILGLTNVYTKEAYPNMNRAARKRAEFLRIANLNHRVKSIKLADRLANIIDMDTLEGGFKDKFIDETKMLLGVIREANQNMASLIEEKINVKNTTVSS